MLVILAIGRTGERQFHEGIKRLIWPFQDPRNRLTLSFCNIQRLCEMSHLECVKPGCERALNVIGGIGWHNIWDSKVLDF